MADQLSSNLAALKIDRTAAPPRSGWLRGVATVAVVLALAGAGYAYGVPYLEAKVFKTEVSFTEISSVSPAQATIQLTSTGYVVAQSVSKVAPKVAGRVSKLYVHQSDKVKAGDVLFEIDPADHRASIATGASQVAAARARVMTAKANVAEAEQQLARAENLAQQGLGPKSAADDLRARVNSLKEMTKAAEAEVGAAGASVNEMNVTLSNFTVRAPISGTIVNRPPELGEIVGPQPAGIAADMGGVEIADFNTLEVEVDVPEQRLSLVKMNGPAEIVLDAYPDKRHRGKAVELLPKVDRSKATVVVKVAFVDATEGVLPDMSARVSFLAEELDPAQMKAPPKIVVPGNAVVTVNGNKVVYTVEDGKARMRPIQLGPAFGSGFEVADGPKPGARLVKDPPQGLADGQPIKEKVQ